MNTSRVDMNCFMRRWWHLYQDSLRLPKARILHEYSRIKRTCTLVDLNLKGNHLVSVPIRGNGYLDWRVGYLDGSLGLSLRRGVHGPHLVIDYHWFVEEMPDYWREDESSQTVSG